MWKMTKNRAENEGMFVLSSTSFALAKCPSPWRRHVSKVKMIFFSLSEGMLRLSEGLIRLGEPESVGLQDVPPSPWRRSSSPWRRPFASTKLSISLGIHLHLGGAVPSPWRRSAYGASSAFLLFLPSSLLALFSIPSKLT